MRCVDVDADVFEHAIDGTGVGTPAAVEGGKLVIRDLPKRARLPIEVEVVAWQLGRAAEPFVKTAEPVSRTFKITP